MVVDTSMPPKAKGKSTAALRRLLDGQEHLKLAGDLGEGGATALAQAIKTNNSLIDVYLWQTHLKAQGVTAIAEALVGNTKVKNLTIGEDSLTDHHSAFSYGANDIGPEGAKVLSSLLRENDTLELLNLWGVGVGEQGARHFAEVLDPARPGHNTRLEWLGLEKNEIGEIGCTALSECLERNCYLVARLLRCSPPFLLLLPFSSSSPCSSLLSHDGNDNTGTVLLPCLLFTAPSRHHPPRRTLPFHPSLHLKSQSQLVT